MSLVEEGQFLWRLVENCSAVFQGAVGACSSRPRLRQRPQAVVIALLPARRVWRRARRIPVATDGPRRPEVPACARGRAAAMAVVPAARPAARSCVSRADYRGRLLAIA